MTSVEAPPSDGSESFSPSVKIHPYKTKNYSDMAIRSMLLDAHESGDTLELLPKSVFRRGKHYPTVAVLNADRRLVVRLLFHDMDNVPPCRHTDFSPSHHT